MRINLKSKKLKIFGVIIFLLLVLAVSFIAARWVISLRDPVKLEAFQNRVASLGVVGWLVLFVIQYLHIVIALIPGGPIQIAIGALLGPWGGFAICLSGIFLATATVFWLVSRYGHSVISLFVGERDIKQYKFLNDEKKVENLVLILFFLPGTPKDALTYLFALTDIKMSRFLALSILARLPAVATSLVAGDSIMAGRWGRALTMFIIMTAVSLLGLWIHRRLMKRVERKG